MCECVCVWPCTDHLVHHFIGMGGSRSCAPFRALCTTLRLVHHGAQGKVIFFGYDHAISSLQDRSLCAIQFHKRMLGLRRGVFSKRMRFFFTESLVSGSNAGLECLSFLLPLVCLVKLFILRVFVRMAKMRCCPVFS